MPPNNPVEWWKKPAPAGVKPPPPPPAEPPQHLATINSAKIFAGSYKNVLERKAPYSVLLNCAGNGLSPGGVDASHALCVTVEWPDYGVPPLDLSDWKVIANLIAIQPGDIGIYCFGGHGRTGTALAVLFGIWGLIPEGACPVLHIRSIYRQKAVESVKQFRYIEQMTGLKVLAPEPVGRFMLGWPNYQPGLIGPGADVTGSDTTTVTVNGKSYKDWELEVEAIFVFYGIPFFHLDGAPDWWEEAWDTGYTAEEAIDEAGLLPK